MAMALHGSISNLGCSSVQMFVNEQLSATWRVYLAWEEINDRVADFVIKSAKRVATYYEIHGKETKKSLLSVYKSIDAAARAPRLTSLCFEALSIEEKSRLHDCIPHIGIDLIKKKNANRVIQNFCRAWIVWFRAKNEKARRCSTHSNSLILAKKKLSQNVNENANSSQVCWALSKIKLRTLVLLFSTHSPDDFEYLNMNVSSWNGLYIMWLINPGILTVLFGVFLTCDVALPQIRKLLFAVIALVKRLKLRILNLNRTLKKESTSKM